MGFPCRPTSYDLVGPVGDSMADLVGDPMGDPVGNPMVDPVGDPIVSVVSFDRRHFLEVLFHLLSLFILGFQQCCDLFLHCF